MRGRITQGFLILAVACAGTPYCAAQLIASLDDENFLVLEADGLMLLAVEFRSPSGSLVPSEIPAPFQGVLVQDDSLALYYNLGMPFVLDGSVTLATKWDTSMLNDIHFQYGTPTNDHRLQPILGHQAFAGEVSSDAVIVSEFDTFRMLPEPACRAWVPALLLLALSYRNSRHHDAGLVQM